MQTKYEQITELRETATLINQLEFKIQFNSNSIEQLTKYNSHKENTDLINELTAITDRLKTDLQKHKEVFDLLLSNIKPYQPKEDERELKVGDILVYELGAGLPFTKNVSYPIISIESNIIGLRGDNGRITYFYETGYKNFFTLK